MSTFAKPPYPFKLPISGVDILWQPLSVGAEMDIEATYSTPNNRHLQKYAVISKRITKHGSDAYPLGMEPNQLRALEAADIGAFVIEYERVEAARDAAFRRHASTGEAATVGAQLEAQVAELRLQLEKSVRLLADVAVLAREAERASTPLPPGPGQRST